MDDVSNMCVKCAANAENRQILAAIHRLQSNLQKI